LTEKPHGKYPLPKEIIKAQLDKQQNPNKYKFVDFNDKKVQSKAFESLPHPYEKEIEDIEGEIRDMQWPQHIEA
jgi:hypothetical protein